MFFEIEQVTHVDLNKLECSGYDPQFIEYGLANILAGEKVTWKLAEVVQDGTASDLVALLIHKVSPPRRIVAQHFQLGDNWSPWLHYPRWQLGLLSRSIRALIRLMRGDGPIAQNASHDSIRRRLDEWLNP